MNTIKVFTFGTLLTVNAVASQALANDFSTELKNTILNALISQADINKKAAKEALYNMVQEIASPTRHLHEVATEADALLIKEETTRAQSDALAQS